MWQTFRKVNSAAPLSPVWTNGYTYRSSLPSRNPVFWMFCYLPPKEATFLSSDGGVLKFKIQDLITYRQMQCSDILRISPIFSHTVYIHLSLQLTKIAWNQCKWSIVKIFQIWLHVYTIHTKSASSQWRGMPQFPLICFYFADIGSNARTEVRSCNTVNTERCLHRATSFVSKCLLALRSDQVCWSLTLQFCSP